MYINKILMNYFKTKIKIIIAMVLIIVIVFVLLVKMNKNKEGFTTGIREMYRPYLRSVRLIYDNYYNKLKTNIQLFFRKIGLI
jgi:hypothetical protein